MEFVDGVDLATFFFRACEMRNNTFPDEKIYRRIFFDVLLALKSMHEAGVAHRDIKPENILISGGKIKIIDLGFALNLAGRDGTALMRTPKGTPSYAAPEILKGEKYYGNVVDWFAFGVLMLTLRVMETPFEHADINN